MRHGPSRVSNRRAPPAGKTRPPVRDAPASPTGTADVAPAPLPGGEAAVVDLDRLSPVGRHGVLLRLQRTVGNTAVNRLLHPDAAGPIRRELAAEFAPREREPATEPDPAEPTGDAPPEGDVPLNAIRGDVTYVPELGIGVAAEPSGGVMVTDLLEDHPAEDLLHEGDVLLTADFLAVTGPGLLRDLVAAKSDGDVMVFLRRPGDLEAPNGGLDIPFLGDREPTAALEQEAPTAAGEKPGVAGDEPGVAAEEPSEGGEGDVPATEFQAGIRDHGEVESWQSEEEPVGGVEIQRQPANHTSSPFVVAVVPIVRRPPQVNARDWLTKLPRAVRNTAEKQIGKVKDKLELTNTGQGVDAPLSDEQKAIVAQIKLNREQIPISEHLREHAAKGRKEADAKGGYQYGGAGGKQFKKANPYQDEKSRKFFDAIDAEIAHEASISGVVTYDDPWVSLGRGFAGSLLSTMMQRFFAEDSAAKEMFLDVGVSFEGGQLLIVNTDNGGVEADTLAGGSGAANTNARKVMAMSKPILSLYIQIAETEEHAKKLVDIQHSLTFGFNFTPHVAATWNDVMAVRLVAHAIQWRTGRLWPAYEHANDDVKKIVKVLAPVINGDFRDPDKGNARVINADQTGVLLWMAEGKARKALDSPTPEPLPAKIEKDSMERVLLMATSDPEKFYKVTF